MLSPPPLSLSLSQPYPPHRPAPTAPPYSIVFYTHTKSPNIYCSTHNTHTFMRTTTCWYTMACIQWHACHQVLAASDSIRVSLRVHSQITRLCEDEITQQALSQQHQQVRGTSYDSGLNSRRYLSNTQYSYDLGLKFRILLPDAQFSYYLGLHSRRLPNPIGTQYSHDLEMLGLTQGLHSRRHPNRIRIRCGGNMYLGRI